MRIKKSHIKFLKKKTKFERRKERVAAGVSIMSSIREKGGENKENKMTYT